ncbi:MAG: small multi-drug export protein [Patescibacteria group bacterium]|nr:small multi-drug export protein [Patescibacteria group bacterium]
MFIADYLLQLFIGWPPELATFFLAMIPIGELRLAIPVSIAAYHLAPWEAFVWSVAGNMVPVAFILFFAERFNKWVEKNSGFLFGKAWVRYLRRAQEKFAKDYEKYGLIGLAIFVGIPLPLTGAFTGALAAFVFGIPMRKAMPYIFAGVIMAGLITLFLTVGAVKVF